MTGCAPVSDPAPLRSIIDTEYDLLALANLCRAMDIALLHLVEHEGATPGDLEALAHLSGLVEPAARRALDDFMALNVAGIFAPLQARGREAAP